MLSAKLEEEKLSQKVKYIWEGFKSALWIVTGCVCVYWFLSPYL
jgi:hypothetical protein